MEEEGKKKLNESKEETPNVDVFNFSLFCIVLFCIKTAVEWNISRGSLNKRMLQRKIYYTYKDIIYLYEMSRE